MATVLVLVLAYPKPRLLRGLQTATGSITYVLLQADTPVGLKLMSFSMPVYFSDWPRNLIESCRFPISIIGVRVSMYLSDR